MVEALKDDGIGLKEEVEDGVCNGKVKAGEQNDRFVNNHMDWTHEGHSHHLPSALLFELDSCEYIGVCRLLPHASCSLLQDDWSVGLGEEAQEDERGSSDNQADPERPPPRNDGDKA